MFLLASLWIVIIHLETNTGYIYQNVSTQISVYSQHYFHSIEFISHFIAKSFSILTSSYSTLQSSFNWCEYFYITSKHFLLLYISIHFPSFLVNAVNSFLRTSFKFAKFDPSHLRVILKSKLYTTVHRSAILYWLSLQVFISIFWSWQSDDF